MIDRKHLTTQLISMMSYKRPAYSVSETEFANKFLSPVFGEPDGHGNFICVVGQKPSVLFASHYDTVHKTPGTQSVVMDKTTGILSKGDFDGECLGADCTTGIWLQLEMIRQGVEGVYVCHAAEEIGGIGSRGLVTDQTNYDNHLSNLNNTPWLSDIDAVISFDRFGTNSIITHQSTMRTCSDYFGYSLSTILLGQKDGWSLNLDTFGSYTDSMEYAGIIPECTNLSVGYFNQHTPRETQDVFFALDLLEKLIQADWGALEIEREPTPLDTWGNYSDGVLEDYERLEVEAIQRLIVDYPTKLAEMLYDLDIDLEVLVEHLNLDYYQVDYYRKRVL
jgi:hypothetical protein